MTEIRELKGANMDVDLTSNPKDLHWEQDECPWNEKEGAKKHKCAVKNVSLCKHFKGIKYPDIVLCDFSQE